MISKTIPYSAVTLSPTGASLRLPANCRFDGHTKVFVWREPYSSRVTVSTSPPDMTMGEMLAEPRLGPRPDDLFPGLEDTIKRINEARRTKTKPYKFKVRKKPL